MFLQRLLERAAGAAPMLRPAPSMAKVLDDPAWGPTPADEGEDEDASAAEVATPTSAAGGRPPRFAPGDAAPSPPEDRAPRPVGGAPVPVAARPGGAPSDPAAASAPAAAPPPPSPLPAAPARLQAGAPPAPVPRERTEAAAPLAGSQAFAAAPQPPPSPRPRLSSVSARLPPAQPVPASPHSERPAPLAATPLSPGLDSVEVVVEIGRIDLVPPPTATPRRPASQAAVPRPGPKLTLAQYLENRRGERR